MTAAPPETLTLERVTTPIGEALLVADEHGVVRAFNWTDYETRLLGWLDRRYPRAERREGHAPGRAGERVRAYFGGETEALEGLPWRAVGTPFQLAVWEALCSIPPGETWSYGRLAQRIGRPTAVRAVGLANGANPIGVIVPCHRVIGSDGSLTGYGGGLPRKTWLLTHEGALARIAA